MMSAQRYPPPVGPYHMGSSPYTRNVYRVDHMPAGSSPYPEPVYFSQPPMDSYGLITPPTQTTTAFGSPLIASGAYPPLPGEVPGWNGMNGLAISPLGHGMPYSYHQSQLMPGDPSCAAPTEVFSNPGVTATHSMAAAYPGGIAPPGLFPGSAHHNMGIKPGMHSILGPDGQPVTEVKKRSRTAQACERCRIRKARCFGGNPCNRCVKRRFVCEFSTAVRQRGPNKAQNGSSSNKDKDSGAASSTATTLKAPRRHSTSDATTSAHPPVLPVAPIKQYSTSEVPGVPSNAVQPPESTPVTTPYQMTSSTVMSHLPTPTYLSVPGRAANGEGANYPSRPQSESSAYSVNGQRSPIFAFTPESENPNASATTANSSSTGSTVDYPYTPISPATTFSPQMAVPPVSRYPAHEADQRNWYHHGPPTA